MTTLSELYTRVRNQTDTNVSESPDTLLNGYLHEAFDRTIAAENLWPFYEKVWDLTLTAGNTTITPPGDVNEPGVIGLWDVDNQFRLNQIGQEKALDFFDSSFVPVTPYGPTQYSLWNGLIRLYPAKTYTTDKDYKLYGYRRAAEWSTLGDGDEPDCDERLHRALGHYATALLYAREEDFEAERNYMERWQRDVEMARQAIMEANRQRPLIIGPHYITPIGVPFGHSRAPWGGVVINTP